MKQDRSMDSMKDRQKRNLSLAINLMMLVAGMVMLSFAAVPLYDMFCRVTGFGGTPLVADEATQTEVVDREITVRFNTDVDPDLNWEFKALEPKVTVKLGEHKLVAFRAKNLDADAETGVAVYNVVPTSAAGYFNKIACFCFDNQRLEAGQEVNMPVSFFIDPEMLDDPEVKDLTTVTLSYTFFKSKNP